MKEQLAIENFLNNTIFGSSLKEILGNENFSFPNYPPVNIYKWKNKDDSSYKHTIEMGVTGFKKNWIDIEIDNQNNQLTIKGKKPSEKKEDLVEKHYITNKLAQRDFIVSYRIHDYTEVESVSLNEGLLKITLVINKPDHIKPKKIIID